MSDPGFRRIQTAFNIVPGAWIVADAIAVPTVNLTRCLHHYIRKQHISSIKKISKEININAILLYDKCDEIKCNLTY